AEHLSSLDSELNHLVEAEGSIQDRLAVSRQALTAQKQERHELRQCFEQAQQKIAELRGQKVGLAGRLEVLEALQRDREGLPSGAREVFTLMAQPEPGPWKAIMGMAVEFLTVAREHAQLIDLALGDRAQRFIVPDAGHLEPVMAQGNSAFSSRVS